MDDRTGEIIYRKSPPPVGEDDEHLVPIRVDEMTRKQFASRQVSLHDHRSTLGIKLGNLRNKSCGCGSGKKYKNCCLFRKEQLDGTRKAD